MKLLISFLMLFLLYSSSDGFGYLELGGTGSMLPGVTARSVAFGGVRSLGIGDGSSILTNPAGMGRLPGTSFTVSIGPGIGGASVLDSLGEHESNWLSLSTIFAGVAIPAGDRLHLGAALGKVTDLSFDYTHNIFDFSPGQTGYLAEIIQLKTKGGMYESVGGLSYGAADWLSLGLSAGMRFGSASYDSTFRDLDEAENDTVVTWERDFSSFCWHGGVEMPLESAVMGFSYASEDDDYPSRAAVGGLLYTNGEGRSFVGAELELGDPGGRNATDVRLFASGFLYDSFEMMGSLNFGTPNYDYVETGTRLGLSLGAGIHLGKIDLDAGFSWASMPRDSLFLVPGRPDELKDSQALISFGFTWRP